MYKLLLAGTTSRKCFDKALSGHLLYPWSAYDIGRLAPSVGIDDRQSPTTTVRRIT